MKWLIWGIKTQNSFMLQLSREVIETGYQEFRIRMENGWKVRLLRIFIESFILPQSQDNISAECLNVIPLSVSEAMNEALLASVLVPKIKKTVFGLGSLKALGPDGLNGDFYQKNWENITLDVVEAILEFFNTGALGDCTNDTVVVLIPFV